MSVTVRIKWLLCFFCYHLSTSRFECLAAKYGSEIFVKFDTLNVRLIASNNSNIRAEDLPFLYDRDPKTCVQGQSRDGRKAKIRVSFQDACFAVTTVKIEIGRTTPASHTTPDVSIRKTCSGKSSWRKCYRVGEMAIQPAKYVCTGHRAGAVDIDLPSNLPMCELTINYLPLPALTKAIQLVNGKTKSEGRVEVLHRGSWGTVCDDFWTIEDAHVVCHQLGYKRALKHNKEAEFGEGTGRIHMDNLECTGKEGRLQDCKFSGWRKHDCKHNEDAGVVCDTNITCNKTESPENTNTFPVRLVDGGKPYRGRLEIFVGGEWGTVCDNNFGHREALVACNQLGYTGYSSCVHKFGETSAPILMDDVVCDEANNNKVPSEKGRAITRLADCFKRGSSKRFSSGDFWNMSTCNHSQDVGLTCDKSAKTLPIRLVDGGAAHKGRVEIFVNGLWGSVCNNSWGLNDAETVCRQLGFPSATAFRTQTLGEERPPRHTWMDNVECRGSERRLQDCSFKGWAVDDCGHEYDAGVECFPTDDSESFDNETRARRNAKNPTAEHGISHDNTTDVRLVSGYGSSEGRVEIYVQNTWTTVCDRNWDIMAANVVCNRLGFSGAVDTFQNAYFGKGKGRIRTIDLRCLRRNPHTLASCFSSSETCSHSNDVGVVCLPHDKDMQQFVQFTLDHNKAYQSGTERSQKAATFNTNLKMIRNLNSADSSSHGITKFADMSENEFEAKYLMSNTFTNKHARSTFEREKRRQRSISDLVGWVGPIPECFDWRDKPSVVTKVKDQGACRASYAFAAVAQMESVWAIQHDLDELSTQQVVSCADTSDGCNGGMPDDAMNYVVTAGGLQSEDQYPYLSGSGNDTISCDFNPGNIRARFRGWAHVTKTNPTAKDEYDMMVFLYRHGPIAVCLNAGGLQFYTRKIWSHCGSDYGLVNHCVVLTGYGVGESGTPYWIARNSWGKDWGDGGYFFIERNVNMCGIADWAYAAYISP